MSVCCAPTTTTDDEIIVGDEPDDLGDLDGDEIDSVERLLLVSTNLPESSLLVDAALSSVDVIHVQYDKWTLAQLREAIVEKCGEPCQQYMSAGLLDHGMPGEFCLLKTVMGGSVDLKDVKSCEELQGFFKFIASYVQAPEELHKWRQSLDCRIDLMACSVAAESGLDFITYLEDLTEVNWAASTNNTGAGVDAKDGFDWVMETEEGLGCIADMYFNAEEIVKWNHTASWFKKGKDLVNKGKAEANRKKEQLRKKGEEAARATQAAAKRKLDEANREKERLRKRAEEAKARVAEAARAADEAAARAAKEAAKKANEAAAKAVEEASKATKDAAEAVGEGLGKATGMCQIGIHNNCSMPILYNFSAIGGAWPEKTRTLQPGHLGKSKPMPCMGDKVQIVTWVSLDGEKFYYDNVSTSPIGKDGSVSKTRAKSVVANDKSQPFVGFSLDQAVKEAKEEMTKFKEQGQEFVKKKINHSIDAFKNKMPDIEELLKDFKPEHKVTEQPKESKSRKKKKVNANDTTVPANDDKEDVVEKGFTIFDSHYDEKLTKGSEGLLHGQVHNLRDNFENVRYLLMDTHNFGDTVKDAANTPEEIRTACRTVSGASKSVRTVAQNMKMGSGGAIGVIAEAVKKAMCRLAVALEAAVDKTEKTVANDAILKKMETIKKKADATQVKMKKVAPFVKLEKANHLLATFEQSTFVLATAWPTAKIAPGIDKKKVAKVDASFKKTGDEIKSINQEIEVYTRAAAAISGGFGLVGSAVGMKRNTLGLIQPVLVVMKKVEEFLNFIWENIIKKIVELPVVKDVLNLMGWVCDFVIKKIMEITRLDQVMDYVAEKINPFKALDALGEKLGIDIPDLDIDKILKISDRMTTIKVIELSEPPFSIKDQGKGIYLPYKA